MKKIIRLTESDLRRIVKRSVNRIINEGKHSPDVNNVVLQGTAEKFGFQPAYSTNDGLEIWEKNGLDKKMLPKLLRRLNIERFTYWSVSLGGYRVGITVKPRFKGGDKPQSGLQSKWRT